jgi:hypothetical protein
MIAERGGMGKLRVIFWWGLAWLRKATMERADLGDLRLPFCKLLNFNGNIKKRFFLAVAVKSQFRRFAA